MKEWSAEWVLLLPSEKDSSNPLGGFDTNELNSLKDWSLTAQSSSFEEIYSKRQTNKFKNKIMGHFYYKKIHTSQSKSNQGKASASTLSTSCFATMMEDSLTITLGSLIPLFNNPLSCSWKWMGKEV